MEPPARPLPLGLLVIDGALTRQIQIGRRRTVELIGPGELVRPFQQAADEFAVVAPAAEWRVLQPARLALIDENLVSGIAGMTGVLSELTGRAIERSRSLAIRLAISQIPHLADRLHLLLWHLADRWGRHEQGKMVLSLRMPHELLAELACAQRSSVGDALTELRARGIAFTRDDGLLELPGDPPGDLLANP